MERRQEILCWLREILNKNLFGVSYSAFIFGSQANKTFLTRSDIDIGIITDSKLTNHQLSKITADIENLPMLYNIDLVNFNEVDAQFKSIALKNIERL